jgi:hypothetical protein
MHSKSHSRKDLPVPPIAARCLLPFLLLAACAPPGPVGDPAGSDQVDRSYTLGGTRWTSGETLYVLYKVREVGGRTAVCGAWADSGGETGGLSREVLGSYVVEIAGDRILHGVDYFTKVANTDALSRATASCRFSTSPWKPAYATAKPDLASTRRSFQLD